MWKWSSTTSQFFRRVAHSSDREFSTHFWWTSTLLPRSTGGGRTRSRNCGKSAKRTLNSATGQWFWKRETWTHKFYCFDKTDQISPENETEEEREVSRRVGLGEKKITFRKNADSAEVLLEFEEAYPRLKDSG